MRWAVLIASVAVFAACNPAGDACREDGSCAANGSSGSGSPGNSTENGSGGNSGDTGAASWVLLASSPGAAALSSPHFRAQLSGTASAQPMQSSGFRCQLGSPYVVGRGETR